MFGPILCFVAVFIICGILAIFATMPFAIKGEQPTTENIVIGVLSILLVILSYWVAT